MNRREFLSGTVGYAMLPTVTQETPWDGSLGLEKLLDENLRLKEFVRQNGIKVSLVGTILHQARVFGDPEINPKIIDSYEFLPETYSQVNGIIRLSDGYMNEKILRPELSGKKATATGTYISDMRRFDELMLSGNVNDSDSKAYMVNVHYMQGFNPKMIFLHKLELSK